MILKQSGTSLHISKALTLQKYIENDDLISFELLIFSLYVSGMKTVAKCPW